jgi:hypothetical protein
MKITLSKIVRERSEKTKIKVLESGQQMYSWESSRSAYILVLAMC